MKTIVLSKPHQFDLLDTAKPEGLAADQALVKIHRVGICGTDLHAFLGSQSFFSYPRILGHELGVEVVALGAEAQKGSINVGDSCAVLPYFSDGTCVACRNGKSNCCVNMQVLGVHTDGGMREYITIPANLLLKAESLSLDYLAQVEMLAIGAHAVRRAQLRADETVLVIGTGPIGLGTIAAAKGKTKRIIALDISPKRLEFVASQGLAETLPIEGDIAASLSNLLDGDLPTAVFDATGNAKSMMNTPNLVAHGGRIIFVGHTKQDLSFHNPTIHSKELSLLMSRNATREDFLNVIETLEQRTFNLDAWITHRASPEELIEQFPSWLEPQTGVIKAMLEFA